MQPRSDPNARRMKTDHSREGFVAERLRIITAIRLYARASTVASLCRPKSSASLRGPSIGSTGRTESLAYQESSLPNPTVSQFQRRLLGKTSHRLKQNVDPGSNEPFWDSSVARIHFVMVPLSSHSGPRRPAFPSSPATVNPSENAHRPPLGLRTCFPVRSMYANSSSESGKTGANPSEKSHASLYFGAITKTPCSINEPP